MRDSHTDIKYKYTLNSTSALIANTDEISRLDRKFLKHAIPQGTIFYSKNKICLLEMLIVQTPTINILPFDQDWILIKNEAKVTCSKSYMCTWP